MDPARPLIHLLPYLRYPGVFVMHLPSHPTLQKLNNLDKSLSEFHDQLSNLLYGEEYAQCKKNLQDDELVWLVDSLDDVCFRIVLPYSLVDLA
jgi:hypothetical protein